MNKKIDLTVLLKDCPSGMELDCLMYEDVYFDYVDERNIIHCYIQHETHKTSITFNQHGTHNNDIKSKCVIFPKGKTTWEGFKKPFVDGDIVMCGDDQFAIFKEHIEHLENEGELIRYYVYYDAGEDYLDVNGLCCIQRLAAEEEKAELFQVIKDNGYKWNADEKKLEKLIEPKFKNGDILYIDCNDNEDTYKQYQYTFILKEIREGKIYCHCYIDECIDEVNINKRFETCWLTNMTYSPRFATEEEKQKLFDAIKANGYKWNDKTKTLEKLIVPKFKVGDKIKEKNERFPSTRTISGYNECIGYNTTIHDWVRIEDQDKWELVPNKFDITTLKPFDKVLVRDNNTSIWINAFFGFYDIEITKKYPFFASAINWTQCIPYEGNEHLLGTYEDCDEYYKNWEE